MENIMKKTARKYAAPLVLATSLYFLSGNAYAQSLPITEQTKITLKQKQDELERKTNEFVNKASEDAKNKFNQYLADGKLTFSEREDIRNLINPIIKKYPEMTSQETKNLYNVVITSLKSKGGAGELETILKKEGVNVKVLPDLDNPLSLNNIIIAICLLGLAKTLYKAIRKRYT